MENTLPITPEALYEADVTRVLNTMPERRTANSEAEWLDSLSQRDRHLIVFEIFHGQVCNGGFGQWAGNGYHHSLIAILLLVLRRAGEQGQVSLVSQVKDLLAHAAAALTNDTASNAWRTCLSEETEERLWALDSQYYTFSDELKADMTAYFARWLV